VLIGVAIVITTYLLINFSFFSVLSYDQIRHNEAVALVSTLWGKVDGRHLTGTD